MSRLTLIDYDSEMALVAVHRERVTDDQGEAVTSSLLALAEAGVGPGSESRAG